MLFVVFQPGIVKIRRKVHRSDIEELWSQIKILRKTIDDLWHMVMKLAEGHSFQTSVSHCVV